MGGASAANLFRAMQRQRGQGGIAARGPTPEQKRKWANPDARFFVQLRESCSLPGGEEARSEEEIGLSLSSWTGTCLRGMGHGGGEYVH